MDWHYEHRNSGIEITLSDRMYQNLVAAWTQSSTSYKASCPICNVHGESQGGGGCSECPIGHVEDEINEWNDDLILDCEDSLCLLVCENVYDDIGCYLVSTQCHKKRLWWLQNEWYQER